MHQHRQGVRLGSHQNEFIYERAAGLRDAVTGIAVVGGSRPDPEILFEEHGMERRCEYLEIAPNAELNVALGPAEPRHDIAQYVNDPDARLQFHALVSAFALDTAARANEMMTTLRAQVAPTGGTVTLVRASWRFLRRRGMIRMTAAAQAQPTRDIESLIEGAHPLEHHQAGGESLYQYLLAPSLLLGSPFASGLVAGRVVRETSETYLLVVTFGHDQGVLLSDGEVLWHEVFESTLPDFRDTSRPGLDDWLRDVNASATQLPFDQVLRWWIDGVNALLTELTDLGRYRLPDGLLDGRRAYRDLRTLDRLFACVTRIQTRPHDHVARVNAAFEFFDLLPNLMPTEPSAATVYDALVNPGRAGAVLTQAAAPIPGAFGDHFQTRSDTVLNQLRTETIETVVPGRLTDDQRVLVGAESPQPIDADAYVGKLHHQLRNTHHGYELRRKFQRTILESHTGHIPYAFAELPVLYLVAFLADPAHVLAGSWFTAC